MQPLMVVSDFEKGRQFRAQRVQIAPLSAMHLLLFERLNEGSALALS